MIERREVTLEEAQKMAVKHGFEYFETSAKTGENVDVVFERMTAKVLGAIESSSIDPT
jgi:Ras-related protein Rab-2A